jgi:hypothetical protein
MNMSRSIWVLRETAGVTEKYKISLKCGVLTYPIAY